MKLTQELRDELFSKHLILAGYRGSFAQGTYISSTDPNSIDDVDLMGVYLAPTEYYIGLGRGQRYRKGVERFIDEYDVVNYELRKFMNLLLNANPNVLSLLWLNNNHYLNIKDQYLRDMGLELIASRNLFSSKKAYNSFTGYAHGQLKRMTSFKFEGYMGEKRKTLVEKFGYDCKNAGHLIRLLNMGIEFLTEGKLYVFRKDAEVYIDIKTGGWTLQKVQEEANRLFKTAKEAYVRSPLPEEPDYEGAEELMSKIITNYLNWKRDLDD